jgi:hypothetical protein
MATPPSITPAPGSYRVLVRLSPEAAAAGLDGPTMVPAGSSREARFYRVGQCACTDTDELQDIKMTWRDRPVCAMCWPVLYRIGFRMTACFSCRQCWAETLAPDPSSPGNRVAVCRECLFNVRFV